MPDVSLPLVRYQIGSLLPHLHSVQFCCGTPLDPPKFALVRTVAPPQVPRYRVLALLGVGGMGAVYTAEQQQPRRTVALKVIKPGLVTPWHLRRFSYEAAAS